MNKQKVLSKKKYEKGESVIWNGDIFACPNKKRKPQKVIIEEECNCAYNYKIRLSNGDWWFVSEETLSDIPPNEHEYVVGEPMMDVIDNIDNEVVTITEINNDKGIKISGKKCWYKLSRVRPLTEEEANEWWTVTVNRIKYRFYCSEHDAGLCVKREGFSNACPDSSTIDNFIYQYCPDKIMPYELHQGNMKAPKGKDGKYEKFQ